MIGYVYVTKTTDGMYYVGQHKKSEFDTGYNGSGRLLCGKEVAECKLIEYAGTMEELNEKEAKWIVLCSFKHGKNCLNISGRGSSGNYKVAVNHKTLEVVFDLETLASRMDISIQTLRKYINRIDGGPQHFKQKGKLKGYQKQLYYDWVYMEFADYMSSKKLS